MADCTSCGGNFKGRGEVRIAPYGSPDNSRLIGNVAILQRTINTNSEQVTDYSSDTGGSCGSADLIESISLQIDLKDAACPDNAALALLGVKTAVTAGTTVTAEEHVSYHGSIVRVASMPDPDAAIVVKDETDTTTYVLNTDYTVTKHGYVIPLSTGSITDGQVLHITYDTLGSYKIDAIVGGFSEYVVFFDGINTFNGKRVRSVIYRAKLTAAAEFSLISDNHVTLSLSGTCANDSTNGGVPFQDEYYV